MVVDGRYSIPYIPEGVYAELRQAVSSRDRIIKEQNALTNRIKRWLKIYFPEYLKVYTKYSAESGLLLLKKHRCLRRLKNLARTVSLKSGVSESSARSERRGLRPW